MTHPIRRVVRMIAFGAGYASVLLSSATIAQEKKGAEAPLALTISGSTRVCVDHRFTLKAKLVNTGPNRVLVDRAGFWRYITETALDQSSTTSTVSGASLKIPVMRGTNREIFVDSETDRRRLVLKPGQAFKVSYQIDPASDNFYKLPGRYAVRMLYSTSLEPAEQVTVPYAEAIESPEFSFEIVRCGT